MFEAILATLLARVDDIAAAITAEMGAPYAHVSCKPQPCTCTPVLGDCNDAEVLKTFAFETDLVSTQAIPTWYVNQLVCALITPWNWPVNQIACKVTPALASRLYDGIEAQ